MGKVTLLNGYFIDADTRSYNLNKLYETPRVDKNGRVTESEVVGYYSTLESAVSGFRKIYRRETIDQYEGDLTLDKAIQLLSKADEALSALLKDYNLSDY